MREDLWRIVHKPREAWDALLEEASRAELISAIKEIARQNEMLHANLDLMKLDGSPPRD